LFSGKEEGFTISRATDEDIGVCADMVSKAMGIHQIDKEAIEPTLKSPNIILLVAKAKEKIVGMISGIVFPSLIPPPRIDFLGVPNDENAKKGLHSILIDAFIEELKKSFSNIKYIDTNVPATNIQFIAMYSLKGWMVTGFTKSERPLDDVVLLRKNLSK
jgi:hypothetical protein